MEKVFLQSLDRKKLQQEGLDFVFQYYCYKRENQNQDWQLQPGNITSYEPEEFEHELEKQELVRIILVPFRYTEEDMFNEIKLDDEWVPVKESEIVLSKEELEEKKVELWKNC